MTDTVDSIAAPTPFLNPVLMLCYNTTLEQLVLTQVAVDSVLKQDIPVSLTIINNGSNQETVAWLDTLVRPTGPDAQTGSPGSPNPPYSPAIQVIHHPSNISPSILCNRITATIFKTSPYVLGVPNDVILPPNCYRQLLRWPRGFVCASDNGQNMPSVQEAVAVSENTPMAVMLTRRWAYDALMAKDGYFLDEKIFLYASDCDLALRMAACGIRGVQLNLPFWHYGSASHRLADREVSRAINQQADRDREYFFKKYGFKVDSLEYGQIASDPNFKAGS